VVATVDSHQHYWDIGRFQYGWVEAGRAILDRNFLPHELEPQMRAADIKRSVLVQALNQPDETGWLLSLADIHASIAGVVGWVDLTKSPGEIEKDLAELLRHPRFSGIRHLVESEPDDDWLVRPDVLDGLGALEQSGVPFDLLIRPQHLKHVPVLSERHPSLNMVIDHIAKPGIRERVIEPWGSDIREASRNARIMCKLSGMVTEADQVAWTPDDLAPYIEVVLDAFGAERLMFGSDWPVCTLAGSYHRTLVALRHVLGHLRPQEEAAIFGGNASRFYRLMPGLDNANVVAD